MSGRYQRAFTIAVVVLVAGWHLAGAGGQLLHNRPDYGSFAFQGAMWLVMALAIAAGSVLVLRGSPGWRLGLGGGRDRAGRQHGRGGGQPGRPDAGGQLGVGERGLDGRARAAPPPVRRAGLVPRRRGRWPPSACRCGTGWTALDLAGFLAVLAWSTGAQIAVAAGGQGAGRRRRPGRRGGSGVSTPRASGPPPPRSSRPPGTPAGWRCRKAPSRWWPSWRRGGRPGRRAGAGQVRGPGGPAAAAAGRGR